jgi:NADH-quinone oxidoreductase subunit J
MTPLALLPAALALALCLVAITRPNVVHALIWLVAALLSLAASFFALGAGFAGAVQILIYAGAIMAVFVFVVMTVDSAPSAIAAERERIAKAWPLPAIAAAGLFAALAVRLGPAEPAATATGGAVPRAKLGRCCSGPGRWRSRSPRIHADRGAARGAAPLAAPARHGAGGDA